MTNGKFVAAFAGLLVLVLMAFFLMTKFPPTNILIAVLDFAGALASAVLTALVVYDLGKSTGEITDQADEYFTGEYRDR